MQGNQGPGPHVAVVLPGAFGDGAKALPAASPDASGAASAAGGGAGGEVSDRHCDTLRLLAARALRGRVPVHVRRVPVRHTSPAIGVTAGIRLPKLHSRPRGRTLKVEVLRSPASAVAPCLKRLSQS